MNQLAATLSAARLDRISQLALWLAVLIAVVALPIRTRDFILPVLPRAALAASPQAQARLTVAPVPYNVLMQANRTLPLDARVLLVTDGSDVRTREYQTFHRALYYLTPRPVWWLSPAPSDGTWEARWWHSSPLTEDSIRSFAAAKNANYILLLANSDLFTTANIVSSWDSAKLIRLDDTSPPHIPLASPEFAGAGSLPRMFLALFGIFFSGVFIVEILIERGSKFDPVEWFGLAWSVGVGIIALFMLTLNINASFAQLPELLITVFSFTGLVLFARRLWRTPRPPLSFTLPSLSSILLLAVLTLETSFVAIIALGQPLVYWDSWVTWSIKARAIFLQSAISAPVISDLSRAVTHLDYPLLLPLNQAWLFRFLSAPDDRFVGWLALGFYLSLLALVFGAVKKQGAPSRRALLAAAVVGSMPTLTLLAAANFADIPLTVYAVLNAACLLRWIQRGERGALVLALIGAACLAFTKREGVVLVLCVSLAALLTFPRAPRARVGAFACASIAVCVAFAWNLFLSQFNLTNTDSLPLSLSTLAQNLDRLPAILVYFTANVFDPQWSFVWLFVVVLVLLRVVSRTHSDADLFLITALVYLVIAASNYLFSAFVPFQSHLFSSGYRLIAQVAPLAVLWLALQTVSPSRESRIPSPRSQGQPLNEPA